MRGPIEQVAARLIVALALLGLLGLTGCVEVRPWEREMLARPDMSWDEDPRLSAIKGHVYFSKEATFSSGGSSGGGCGCN